MRTSRIILFAAVILSIGCSTKHKIAFGVQSKFTLQSYHTWINPIEDSSIDAFEFCCFREGVPIFLHRAIRDNRGWVLFIGAGEGVSKQEISDALKANQKEGVLHANRRFSAWSWTLSNGVQVARYAFDESRSGLLLTLDFVVPAGADLDSLTPIFESEILNCIETE